MHGPRPIWSVVGCAPGPSCRQMFGAKLNTAAKHHPREDAGDSLSALSLLSLHGACKGIPECLEPCGNFESRTQSGRSQEGMSWPGQGWPRILKPTSVYWAPHIAPGEVDLVRERMGTRESHQPPPAPPADLRAKHWRLRESGVPAPAQPTTLTS